MKIAVFDCPAGIAGDMAVGAFLDAGVPFSYLKERLQSIDPGSCVLTRKTVRAGAFRAVKFSVRIGRKARPIRTLPVIKGLIHGSRLPGSVQTTALRIFRNLGRAEAAVHGYALKKIHFHEIGAIDSIMDIAGAALCFHYLGIQRAFVRRLYVGKGLQTASHGEMPVPVPGAYELLRGFSIAQSKHEGEMVTPTGAAILKTLCSKSAGIPKFRLDTIGYGAGDRLIGGVRGIVRVSIGKT